MTDNPFRKGQIVRLSQHGLRTINPRRDKWERHGVVQANPTGEIVQVIWDGTKSAASYHHTFVEDAS